MSLSPSLYLNLPSANNDHRREATSESPNDCPSAAEPPLAADHLVRPIGCPQIPNTHTNRPPCLPPPRSSPTFPPALRPEPPSITHNHRPHPELTEDASAQVCHRASRSTLEFNQSPPPRPDGQILWGLRQRR
ncbi:hypothetical protein STAS_28475 [Striga asiatica]|uniref:Uncharacterized protein n=1 Tax=Striga asiatica TaxID=4170 RepID=A0A5A7R0C2_STRAF|nr:hypothetical protein STAS_28475 [Striga asiatica]